MHPRIVSRTHYQVDEPAYLTVLCKRCVSASQTAYPESVADKLTDELRSRGKEFNPAAGRYAVDLAKALGLITNNHVLSPTGQLVNLVADLKDGGWDQQLSLSTLERLLYFRVFLEEDGAAFVYLISRVIQDGQLPNEGTNWNSIATDMFTNAYTTYLELTNNTADRVALRNQRDRMIERGYSGKSGAHQMFLHVQTLFRLGLLDRVEAGVGRVYCVPTVVGHDSLKTFAAAVPDIPTLEKIFQRNQWADVAAATFNIQSSCTDLDVISLLAPYYDRLTASGVPLCSLNTLIEAVQIELLGDKSTLLTYDNAMSLIHKAQKASPKAIRFHVDRRGTPAFLKLSNDIVGS